MNKHWLISAAALTLVATAAIAAQDAPPASPAAAAPQEGQGHEWTLEEARKHAHERADKLDKMTPQEWAEHQKKRHDWMDKWHAMTPAEKEAWKKKKHDERELKKQSAAPAASTAAPATAPAEDK